jgi:hypothetical protein
MIDIEGIKKRVDHCHSICATDIESLLSEVERLTGKAHDNYTIASQAINDGIRLQGELDELRTRNARIVDSMDTFVAALVDERFKKDHAAMLAELHELRTKDIEASKRLRIEIAAMPETVRTIFESARVGAKATGGTIVRTLVDMVANIRAVAARLRTQNNEQSDRIGRDDDRIRALGIERNGLKESLIVSRDECRQHLDRINVLESENIALRDGNARASLADGAPVPMMLHCPMCHARHIDEGELATHPHKTHACQTCGVLWRPAIVATVGVHFLPGCKNATTLPANGSTGQDVAKVEDKAKDATSGNVVANELIALACAVAGYRSTVDTVGRVEREAMLNNIGWLAWSALKRNFPAHAALLTANLYGNHEFNRMGFVVGQEVRVARGMCKHTDTGRITSFIDSMGQAFVDLNAKHTLCVNVADLDPIESIDACTCPATSEYDGLCPRHGLVGIGVTPRN